MLINGVALRKIDVARLPNLNIGAIDVGRNSFFCCCRGGNEYALTCWSSHYHGVYGTGII